MRRIGLLGGAFDPVHDAHLALGHAALSQLNLDEIRWIPSGHPMHKHGPAASAGDRAAMVALAIEHEPRFVLDMCEIEREGPSYTIDTVMELQAAQCLPTPGGETAEPCEWFLIVGQDQLARFHTWQGWQALVTKVILAVANRAGDEPVLGPELSGAPIRLVEIELPAMEVSSTEIRNRLSEGRSLAGLVPDTVARYIARHTLYTETPRS